MCTTGYTLTLPPAREPTFASSIPDGPLSGSTIADAEHTDAAPMLWGGKLLWIGNATCIIELSGIRFMTDPNFLHQGDHVHLGPGVTAQRMKDPVFDYEHCPAVDFILLSHLHGDHFDQLVAEKIRKNLPIISTPHACDNLKPQGHTGLFPLQTWETINISKEGTDTEITITSMPGKHTPVPDIITDISNKIDLHFIPPFMGSMITFKSKTSSGTTKEYNMYISGDTLYYDELKEIHHKYPHIDLALIHLGGTTLPVIRVMVTMDAVQGMKLLFALQPDKAIPIHFDDYDVFLSPLSDFKDEVKKANWENRVVYLQRGEGFKFWPVLERGYVNAD